MNDNATLQVTQPKEQRKVGAPWNLPGAIKSSFMEVGELFGEVIDAATDLGEIVTEGPVRNTKVTELNQLPEYEALTDFNKPRSIEDVYQKREEINNNRFVYSTLEEARNNAQRFAHEAELDMSARLEVAGMSGDEKKVKLHLSRDLDDQHINHPYHMSILYSEKKQELKHYDRQDDQITATEVAPRGPDFNKNKANELGPTSIYNAAG